MTSRSYGQFCGVAVALDLLGERWTVLIVRDLMPGPQRFVDLSRRQPAMATDLLTARLRSLEEVGIVHRVPLPAPAKGSMYALTADGEALRPLVSVLARVGAQRLADPVVTSDRFDAGWALATFAEHLGSCPTPGGLQVHADGEAYEIFEHVDGTARLRYGTSGNSDVAIVGPAFDVIGMLLGRLEVADLSDVEVTGELEAMKAWVRAIRASAPSALRGA